MNEPPRVSLPTQDEPQLPSKIFSEGANTAASLPPPSQPLYFDGGETGCGELLLDLLLFMRPHPGGSQAVIRALDPGAPLEIPAWCRLTGHRLLKATHPLYLIQKPAQKIQERT